MVTHVGKQRVQTGGRQGERRFLSFDTEDTYTTNVNVLPWIRKGCQPANGLLSACACSRLWRAGGTHWTASGRKEVRGAGASGPPPVPPSPGPPALCSRWAIVVHLGFTATPGRRWCVPHLKNSMGHREVDQPSCRHTSVRGRADFASDRLTPGSGLAGDRAHQWTPSTLGMLLRFFLQQPSS